MDGKAFRQFSWSPNGSLHEATAAKATFGLAAIFESLSADRGSSQVAAIKVASKYAFGVGFRFSEQGGTRYHKN